MQQLIRELSCHSHQVVRQPHGPRAARARLDKDSKGADETGLAVIVEENGHETAGEAGEEGLLVLRCK